MGGIYYNGYYIGFLMLFLIPLVCFVVLPQYFHPSLQQLLVVHNVIVAIEPSHIKIARQQDSNTSIIAI